MTFLLPEVAHGPNLEGAGDALGVNGFRNNHIMRTTLGDDKFWCPSSGVPALSLPSGLHPAIRFSSPVSNVHVTIEELSGTVTTGIRRRLLWDADFGTRGRQALREISEALPSEGGDRPHMDPLCAEKRLELHVNADDALDGEVDHGIDEVVQFVHRASPVQALGAERVGAVEKAFPPEPAAPARGAEPGGPRASGLTLATSVAHPALACLTLAGHPQCVRRRALLGCFF
mmetsp:Transcript_43903/g.115983  ORF Transcript_43903/g.115983 Transcript_43903/m.115983 type:complete len:230 (-) Transcript_43903:72-761(-)